MRPLFDQTRPVEEVVRMTNTLAFRATIAVICIVGAGILYVSIHPRHPLRTDDGTSPKLPTTETTPVSR